MSASAHWTPQTRSNLLAAVKIEQTVLLKSIKCIASATLPNLWPTLRIKVPTCPNQPRKNYLAVQKRSQCHMKVLISQLRETRVHLVFLGSKSRRNLDLIMAVDARAVIRTLSLSFSSSVQMKFHLVFKRIFCVLNLHSTMTCSPKVKMTKLNMSSDFPIQMPLHSVASRTSSILVMSMTNVI